MKHVLTALLLLVTSFVSAQIVNIPDPAFKQQLLNHSPAIDTNFDGEIQVSEALAVTWLQIDDFLATDMTGIEAFKNLQTAGINSFTTTSLDLTGLSHLTDLTMNISVLTSINLTGCIAIENLKITGSPTLTTLDIHSCINLKKLELFDMQIPAIDLDHCPLLETLNLKRNQILASIDVSHCPKLKIFICEDTQLIPSIDLSNCPILESVGCINNGFLSEFIIGPTDSLIGLSCYGNPHLVGNLDLTHYKNLKSFTALNLYFSSVNFSGLNKLVSLICDGPNLFAINLGGCSSLKLIQLNSPILTYANLTGCSGLLELYAHGMIKTLDLSTCINLQTLYVFSNDSLQNLNIKNGSMLNDFHFVFPNPINICADNFEIDTLQHFLSNSRWMPVRSVSRCRATRWTHRRPQVRVRSRKNAAARAWAIAPSGGTHAAAARISAARHCGAGRPSWPAGRARSPPPMQERL